MFNTSCLEPACPVSRLCPLFGHDAGTDVMWWVTDGWRLSPCCLRCLRQTLPLTMRQTHLSIHSDEDSGKYSANTQANSQTNPGKLSLRSGSYISILSYIVRVSVIARSSPLTSFLSHLPSRLPRETTDLANRWPP